MSLLSTLHQPDLSWQDKVAYLAWKISQAGGQGPETAPVKHIFEKGRYIREMELPADFIFIGRPHLQGHIVLLMEGKAKVITELGTFFHTGPDAMLTHPGFQMLAHILTPVRVRTIHPNPSDCEDWEDLEDSIFGPVEPVLLRGQAVQAELQKLLEVPV